MRIPLQVDIHQGYEIRCKFWNQSSLLCTWYFPTIFWRGSGAWGFNACIKRVRHACNCMTENDLSSVTLWHDKFWYDEDRQLKDCYYEKHITKKKKKRDNQIIDIQKYKSYSNALIRYRMYNYTGNTKSFFVFTILMYIT